MDIHRAHLRGHRQGLAALAAACCLAAASSSACAEDGPRPGERATGPAQPAVVAPVVGTAAGGPVVVAGVVPDEATRQAILGQVRAVYGERVVDQLGVGRGVAPPRWGEYVQKLITPDLKRVSHGQMKVVGQTVELTGEVPTEALGQQLASRMSAQLNPTYTVRNGLRATRSDQQVLDAAMARRIVEFEPGNAVLTGVGLRTLDALLPVLAQFRERRFEVVGHTDALGEPAQNQRLSADRATAVKSYLVARGVGAETIATAGAGADRPVADNTTPEGRARNRRIEVRLLP